MGLFENTLFAGIPEVLTEFLDMGFELRVVTSKPKVYADRIIDHFGLRGFFPEVYGSELSGERSNKGDLIRHVLSAESIQPGCACMIGDRRYDIEGAKSNGVHSIGVLWGFGDRTELATASPSKIVEDVGGLIQVVRELTRGG